MVATRSHPRGDFPAFEPSPTKRPSRTSTASPAPSGSPDLTSSPTKTIAKRAISDTIAVAKPAISSKKAKDGAWCHTVSNITVAWLAISIPLVLWDSLYILLRPHTMAGGSLQWPIWKPYEIYAAIDHVYGWPGWENKDGFGGAQGLLNAVELVMYGLYAMILYNHSTPSASGTGLQASRGVGGWLSGARQIRGPVGNRALLLGFAAAVMTLSKTCLYYANEAFCGFSNIKHNDWVTIALFYGIMNGLWVMFPAYMVTVFGTDIIEALDLAVESSSRKRQ